MSTAPPRPNEVRQDTCRPLEPLGGIVLDVPDVLYDATLWRRWLFQLLGRLGIVLTYPDFDCDWNAQLVDVHRGRREYGEALQSFLLDQGLSWAQVDEIEAASGIQRRELELNVRPLAGTTRAIEALAARAAAGRLGRHPSACRPVG